MPWWFFKLDNLNDMIYSALNLWHIFQNYQLPAYSVFIRDCLYTHHVNGVTRIIKAEIRFSPEPTRWLHGVYTDHPGWSHIPGPTRTTTDVLNFPKRSCWHRGTLRITPDVPVQTRAPFQKNLKDYNGSTRHLHGSYAGSPWMWSVLIRHLYGTVAFNVKNLLIYIDTNLINISFLSYIWILSIDNHVFNCIDFWWLSASF